MEEGGREGRWRRGRGGGNEEEEEGKIEGRNPEVKRTVGNAVEKGYYVKGGN